MFKHVKLFNNVYNIHGLIVLEWLASTSSKRHEKTRMAPEWLKQTLARWLWRQRGVSPWAPNQKYPRNCGRALILYSDWYWMILLVSLSLSKWLSVWVYTVFRHTLVEFTMCNSDWVILCGHLSEKTCRKTHDWGSRQSWPWDAMGQNMPGHVRTCQGQGYHMVSPCITRCFHIGRVQCPWDEHRWTSSCKAPERPEREVSGASLFKEAWVETCGQNGVG